MRFSLIMGTPGDIVGLSIAIFGLLLDIVSLGWTIIAPYRGHVPWGAMWLAIVGLIFCYVGKAVEIIL